MVSTAERAPAWTGVKPIVKWTGGKSAELAEIGACLPVFNRLIEPFAGGAAVLFATPSSIPAAANDASADLISLYNHCRAADPDLIRAVDHIDQAWRSLDAINVTPDRDDEDLAREAARAISMLEGLIPLASDLFLREASRALSRKRRALVRFASAGETVEAPERLIASALKAALYTVLRSTYNAATRGPLRSALFWFLRDFCYGSMFRQNAAGEFNVPYGGMSYDARSMAARLEQIHSPQTRARLRTSTFVHGDFAAFLSACEPGSGDLVFLDPPYDSPFSVYDGNGFSRTDHLRLAAVISGLRCPWMMVISETDFVRSCYCSLPGVRVRTFDKRYAGGIKGRYDQTATHLMITNYTAA